jgi:hypothetical protein
MKALPTHRHKTTGAILALKRRGKTVSTFHLVDAAGSIKRESFRGRSTDAVRVCKNENVEPYKPARQLTIEF